MAAVSICSRISDSFTSSYRGGVIFSSRISHGSASPCSTTVTMITEYTRNTIRLRCGNR